MYVTEHAYYAQKRPKGTQLHIPTPWCKALSARPACGRWMGQTTIVSYQKMLSSPCLAFNIIGKFRQRLVDSESV